MKSLCKILFALNLLAPCKIFACAACYGANIDSPMADGMNWAILTLGIVITPVRQAPVIRQCFLSPRCSADS